MRDRDTRQTQTLMQRLEREGRWQTPVLIAGLPGRMATQVAEAMSRDSHFMPHSVGLSSERHIGESLEFSGRRIRLTQPDRWPVFFTEPRWPYDMRGGTIAVDFTTPESALANAQFYIRHRLPFVMGTTNPHREQIEQLVRDSEISAVIAPNMHPQIFTRQTEIDKMAAANSGIFKGATVRIREIHQPKKRDISGTAIAFRTQYEKYGALPDGEIESIRDEPNSQRIREMLPDVELDPEKGYAYHHVVVTDADGNVVHNFETIVIGREGYVKWTLLAARFLSRRTQEGSRGEVFTQSDVLRDSRSAA